MRRPTALSFVTLALAIGLPGCGGADRGACVSENERVFEELPLFPGSTLVRSSSDGFREEESGPIVGYLTHYELELPGDTTGADVESFYMDVLPPDWELAEELEGPVLNFRRAGARVSVNAENWTVGAMEIAVGQDCS